MKTLGPYELLRKVGTGGMAEVWSARPAGPGAIGGPHDVLALKLLFPHLAEKPRYRDMFLAEARLSLMLQHPNITHTYHAEATPDPEGGPCFMVMELLEGMTLAQLERGLGKRGQKLPLEVSAYVIGEVLRALEYAHSLRNEAGSTVIHRDVSPQNVMLTTDGQVKLMDFGIARFSTEETTGNFVKGKLQYMPPEQFRRATRKPTVDIFAVGAMLHELIDGRPFRAKIEQEKLFAMVLEGEIPPLKIDPSGVPAELEHLRLGMLAADEGQRTQSAQQALQLLFSWPGYVNASGLLQQLVQRFIPPGSARAVPSGTNAGPGPATSAYAALSTNSSGLHSVGSGMHPAAGSQSGPHTWEGWSQATSPSNAELMGQREAAETLPDGQSQPQTNGAMVAPVTNAGMVATNGEVAPPPAPARSSSPQWRLPVFIGLGVLGVGGLAIAIAAMVLNGPADEAPAKDEAPTMPAAPAEPSPAPAQPAPAEPAPEEPAEPAPEEPAPADEPVVEDEPAIEDEDSAVAPGPVRSDDAAKVRVPVEFVANEFFFVYVKINGRVLTLEPRSRVKLTLGRHTVYMRQKPDDDWVKAGRIHLDEEDGSYRVEMTKPHGLKLVNK